MARLTCRAQWKGRRKQRPKTPVFCRHFHRYQGTSGLLARSDVPAYFRPWHRRSEAADVNGGRISYANKHRAMLKSIIMKSRVDMQWSPSLKELWKIAFDCTSMLLRVSCLGWYFPERLISKHCPYPSLLIARIPLTEGTYATSISKKNLHALM